MDLLYIEGVGTDEPRGVTDVAGQVLFTPVLPSDGTVVVPDLRAARALTIVALRDGLRVVHLPEVLLPAPKGPHAAAASEARVPQPTSDLPFMPAKVASAIYKVRASEAARLVGLMDVDRASIRTAAELVLLECERVGFLWDGKVIKPEFDLTRVTRTGRFVTAPGSFRCMSIGAEERDRLRARPDRSIVTFDFNAFDGRSVVSMHPDARGLFGESHDLYADMFRHAFSSEPDDDLRSAFKLQFFRYAYGANEHLTDLGLKLVERFRAAFPWLEDLRQQNHTGDEHVGKGLAIAAQSTSAMAFCGALREAAPLLVEGLRPEGPIGRPLFTVHDELVCEADDGHGVELLVDGLPPLLEHGARLATGVRHRVKVRVGKSYEECKA